MYLDDMINKVRNGNDPKEVINDYIKSITEAPNPLGGVNNLVILVNSDDAPKAIEALQAASMEVEDHGDGILGFAVNSLRDAAAQLLQAKGFKIKSVA